MKKIIFGILIGLTTLGYSTQITHNDYVAGNLITAAGQNTNENNIINTVNGNLDTGNLSASAGIIGSQLANNTITGVQINTTANITVSTVNANQGMTAGGNNTGDNDYLTLTRSDNSWKLVNQSNMRMYEVTGFVVNPSSSVIFDLTPSGTLTLTNTAGNAGGIKGTTTNDNAATGNTGEYVAAAVSAATNFPAATNTWGNLTSISLTAGDWDVSGVFEYLQNGATATQYNFAVDSVSAGPSGNVGDHVLILIPGAGAAYQNGVSIPTVRFSLSGTTTIYAEGLAVFSAGTPQFQCRISARRVR